MLQEATYYTEGEEVILMNDDESLEDEFMAEAVISFLEFLLLGG
jgi:hypothetical protein